MRHNQPEWPRIQDEPESVQKEIIAAAAIEMSTSGDYKYYFGQLTGEGQELPLGEVTYDTKSVEDFFEKYEDEIERLSDEIFEIVTKHVRLY